MAPDEDEELLLEPISFAVTATTVSSLSTQQLAIASLRTDLNVLTRQRAFGLFVTRQLDFDIKDRHRKADHLLEINPYFKLDIDVLSAAELLLVQFNSRASDAIVLEASKEYFIRAREAKERSRKRDEASRVTSSSKALGSPSATLDAVTLRLDKEGRGPVTDSENLKLFVYAKALVVVQDQEDEVWRVESDAITEVQYIAYKTIRENGVDKQDCSLKIKARSYRRWDKLFTTSATVTIALGTLLADDAPFKQLRSILRSWSKTTEFPIGAVNAPPPSPTSLVSQSGKQPRRASPISSSQSRSSSPESRPLKRSRYSEDARERDPPRGRRRSTSPPPSQARKRSPEPVQRRSSESMKVGNGNGNGNGVASGSRNGNGNGNGNAIASGSGTTNGHGSEPASIGRELKSKRSPIWRYVGSKPIDLNWNPGFYTRQAALLQAIDTKANLQLPTFTHEEVVLLSFCADGDKLPVCPKSHDTGSRFPNSSRKAAERIYRSKGYIALESTRWLVGPDCDLPDLKAYVELVAKVVTCHDIFARAWYHLIEVLEKTPNNSTTRDPIDSLLKLVRHLSTSENSRYDLFGESGGKLARGTVLRVDQIGVGPYKRYTDALYTLVQFEDRAFDLYEEFLTGPHH